MTSNRIRTVDVAVIGAGTAGLSARRSAREAGASVLMIEGGPYGTTCARVGCMPSKLFIQASVAAHDAGRAGMFGVDVEGVRVDGPRVLERVRRERDRFVGFVVRDVEALPDEERLRGWARFVEPTVLEVDDEDGGITRVQARSVVVATGNSPWIPPVFRDAGPGAITSDQVFDLPDLPESAAVIGVGIIGLELGQALHRLGVRTRFFSHSHRIATFQDPEMQGTAREVLGEELAIEFGSEVLEAREDGRGVALRYRTERGEERTERFDKVLVATGRRPNLERLDHARAGLELDERGVPRFDPTTMQCGDAPVFVAGDVNAERPLLHEAADEGRIAGWNAALFPDVQATCRRTAMTVVFVHPEAAQVGTPYQELPPEGWVAGEVSYADQGRARVMGENAGRVRIYGEKETGRLLGAEMLGPRVEHTAHLLAWAIGDELTVTQALSRPFYHPVVEEGIKTALRDLSRNLGFPRPSGPGVLDCGPGLHPTAPAGK